MIDLKARKKRNIDIVFCIDGTASMRKCIQKVKDSARKFKDDFVDSMSELGSDLDSMRVKVIVFRDYECDSEAMAISPFFELPAEEDDFAAYLATVDAIGGGDLPENGYEALYFAMKSEFTTGPNDRQVIVLFTDADALELGERAGAANYPADMVDMNGFTNMWACCDQEHPTNLRERNKRLVVYAPEATKYKELCTSRFNRATYVPVDMANGLEEIDFKDVIKIIAASASSN